MSVKRARARTYHQTLATRVTIVNDDDALTRPAHAQCSSEADTQQMHHTQHSHIAKCSEITRFILFLNTFLISILRILCGSRHVTLGRPKLLCRRSFGLFLAWQQRNKKKKHLKLWRWKWTVLEMSTNQPATQTVEAYCKEQAKLSDPYLDIQSIEPFFYFHSLSIWWWRGKKKHSKIMLIGTHWYFCSSGSFFFARIESQNSCIFSIQLHMMIARTASGWIFMCAILMLLMLVGVSLNKIKKRQTSVKLNVEHANIIKIINIWMRNLVERWNRTAYGAFRLHRNLSCGQPTWIYIIKTKKYMRRPVSLCGDLMIMRNIVCIHVFFFCFIHFKSTN